MADNRPTISIKTMKIKKIVIDYFYQSYSKKLGMREKRYAGDELFDTIEEALAFVKSKNPDAYKITFDSVARRGTVYQLTTSGVANNTGFGFRNKNVIHS